MEITISCPHCKEFYLHHHQVEMWHRKEDAPEGHHVKFVPNKCIETNASMTGNPSPRRQGLSISLDCEICGKTSTLSIIQHKGQTLLEVRK